MSYDPSRKSNKSYYHDFTEMVKQIFTTVEQNDEVAFIVWNTEKEVIFVSHFIDELIQFEPEELYGMKWEHTFSGKTLTLIKTFLDEDESFREKLHNDDNYFQFEKENIKYMLRAIQIKQKAYYICQLKDRTYLNELEDKMEHLKSGIIHTEKMAITGEFSAGLVHEIRNPLTSIKGFLQLSQFGIEKKDEYYRVMIDEIEKIEHLTNELLMISKPFTQKKQNVLLKKMIDDTILIIKLQQKYKEISFQVNYKNVSEIYCNEQQIKQVLINLFKNASEAMSMKGTIIVNLSESKDFIKLDVIDEGTGLPDDLIMEIDKPFYTTKKKGTGLGLVVTNQILKQHNARLEIDSKYRKGSKFSILFSRNN